MISLSICIPTYNRAEFLQHLLDSIYSQFDERVEVVVSDNASSDNTCSLMERLATSLPRLHYHRSTVNLGADENFLRVIDFAQGTFCWLMGSDDQIEEGGIKRVLQAIENSPEASGFTLNVKGHSRWMTEPYNPQIGMGQIDGNYFKEDVLFVNGCQAFERISDHFGYIGAQVVHRACWREAVANIGSKLDYFKTGFVHVAVISKILRSRGCWWYLHQQCAGFRTGNDSFLAEGGRYYRLSILVVSFGRILREFWHDKPSISAKVTDLTIFVHVRTFVGRWYLDTPLGKMQPLLMIRCMFLCTPYYWKRLLYWTHVFPFFVVPRPLTFAVRFLVRLFKRLQRS